jgi:hypothetical protein
METYVCMCCVVVQFLRMLESSAAPDAASVVEKIGIEHATEE